MRYEVSPHILWFLFPAHHYLVLSSACSAFPQIKTALPFSNRQSGRKETSGRAPRTTYVFPEAVSANAKEHRLMTCFIANFPTARFSAVIPARTYSTKKPCFHRQPFASSHVPTHGDSNIVHLMNRNVKCYFQIIRKFMPKRPFFPTFIRVNLHKRRFAFSGLFLFSLTFLKHCSLYFCIRAPHIGLPDRADPKI